MLSVFIIAYNAQVMTMHTVESIWSRSTNSVRIHILDNGSTDNTAEWLDTLAQRYPQTIEVFHSPHNLGPHGGKQWLLHHATQTAPIFVVMDNDVEVFTGWDTAIIAALFDMPQTGWVGPLGYTLHHHDGIRKVQPVLPNSYPLPADIITGYCMAIRKEVWEQWTYEDPDLPQWYWHEDDDWCLQLQAAGYINYVIPDLPLWHYGSQSSQLVPQMASRAQSQKALAQLQPFWQNKHIIDAEGEPRRLWQPTPRTTIVWQGAALQSHSLANVSRALFSALIAAEPEYRWAWQPIDSQEGSPWNYQSGWTVASHRVTAPMQPDLLIRHSYPPIWPKAEHPPTIIVQPWEYDGLLPGWKEGLNQAQQIWVPSQRVHNIFAKHGVIEEKIHVIPHGIDPAQFTPDGPVWLDNPDNRFTFLFVGGLLHRKGIDVLIKAYLNAFSTDDPVRLLIRDVGTGSVYATQSMERQLEALSLTEGLPKIQILHQEIPEYALPALYRSADVLLHPIRAEGFGLPILEGMACGIAPIVTANAGADDFLSAQTAWFIPSQYQEQSWSQLGWPNNPPGYAGYQEPDLDAVIAQMQWCANHPELSREKGIHASQVIRNQWTWQHAANIARQAIQQSCQFVPA